MHRLLYYDVMVSWRPLMLKFRLLNVEITVLHWFLKDLLPSNIAGQLKEHCSVRQTVSAPSAALHCV
jgi:hypothetical protein